MVTHELFFATNRKHEGDDRWHPTGYGKKFSDDGLENLRFGKLALQTDKVKVATHLRAKGDYGLGDGIGLSEYLAKQASNPDNIKIDAYEENIPDKQRSELHQDVKLGSRGMFEDLRRIMENTADVLVYIHGFNVSWTAAVGAALALQIRLQQSSAKDGSQNLAVVLFSWPSDGLALPYVSYKSDRTEAAASGRAFARGVLKLRDYLMEICKKNGNRCGQDIHLLCHSMGNYALQEALPKIADYSSGRCLPRIFENIFMCAPDVDSNSFEGDMPLARLPELARSISVYYNREDKAMYISDYTKGNPERLGCDGVARPALLNAKIHNIDCTPIVSGQGLVEHSYYLNGHVNDDIRRSTDGVPVENRPMRRKKGDWPNLWEMCK